MNRHLSAFKPVFDVIEPYRGERNFSRAWSAVLKTCRDEGVAAGERHARQIAEAYDDVRALRLVRASEG